MTNEELIKNCPPPDSPCYGCHGKCIGCYIKKCAVLGIMKDGRK